MKSVNCLQQTLALYKKAEKFGFKWSDPLQVIDQIESECLEIKEEINKNDSFERLKEEIGDVIHASLELAITYNLDLEEIITLANKKYEKRLDALIEVALQNGLNNITHLDRDSCLALWDEAKKITKSR